MSRPRILMVATGGTIVERYDDYDGFAAKTMWALAQAHDAGHLRELFYRPVNCDRLPEE